MNTLVRKAGARRRGQSGQKTRVARVDRHPVATEDRTSAVQHAVERLRRRILTLQGRDPFLGSEDDLIAELGVSRPTFRQAARLLEHERLLRIRRGIGGGFFAQAPTVDAVAHMAAIYLNAQHTSLAHINDAFGPVLIEAACLVARDATDQTVQGIAAFVESNAGFEQREDERDRLRIVLEFERLLASSCGNPAIALMVDVILALVRDPRYRQFRLTPKRALAYAQFHRRVVEAIRLRDVDMTRLLTSKHMAEVSRWQGDAALAAP